MSVSWNGTNEILASAIQKQTSMAQNCICLYRKSTAAIVKQYPHQKGFFKDLPLIEYSREVVEELHNRFEVYVASAAMEFPSSLQDKNEWLDQHFPFIHWKRRIFCGDKSVLKGDVLIDDHDFNLSVFDGRAIIFTASHNVNETKYERLNSWLDAEKDI